MWPGAAYFGGRGMPSPPRGAVTAPEGKILGDLGDDKVLTNIYKSYRY